MTLLAVGLEIGADDEAETGFDSADNVLRTDVKSEGLYSCEAIILWVVSLNAAV